MKTLFKTMPIMAIVSVLSIIALTIFSYHVHINALINLGWNTDLFILIAGSIVDLGLTALSVFGVLSIASEWASDIRWQKHLQEQAQEMQDVQDDDLCPKGGDCLECEYMHSLDVCGYE